MLHEEQIDLRRQRARDEPFEILNLGSKKLFSDYRVSNRKTHGEYTVTIRGFAIGENSCTCPDFKSNTLGTCKHIEAVLASLQAQAGTLRQKRAAITRPEILLHYGRQLKLKLQLPPRISDPLKALAKRFFDSDGTWSGTGSYSDLIAMVEAVPEPVTLKSDALDFIDREIELRTMAEREQGWLDELASNTESPLRQLLKVPLYDYQLRGGIFLACRGRAILGDDMGLGKTVQAMAAVELLARERGIRQVLVVAPASVKYQWETEIRKFTERPVQVIEGLQPERLQQYHQPAFYRLMNYEQVVRDLEAVNNAKPDVVILDEAQRIRNWETKTSRAVKKLRSRYAIVLTGTPLENRLEELYSIVQFVDDRRLGPAFEFLHEHRSLDEKGGLTGYKNLDRVREKLAPILLRRTRGEVLSELPVRTDSTRVVAMRDEQRVPYEEQRGNLARILAKRVLTEIDRRRALACLANMRMICDSLYLVDKQSHISPKLDEFAEVIEELFASGDHKAVVFSQWETMLNEAALMLDTLDVGYVILHGGIPAKDRRALIDTFRDDPNCRVFLTTDAGGVGLNLQMADTVMNLELPWNPAVLEQRIARVHRMGQKRPVRAINFVTKDSIEERVQQAIATKRAIFAGVFDGDTDEVVFAATGHASFLDSVRDLAGIEEKPPAPTATAPDLMEAGVRFLEALAAVGPAWAGTPELRERTEAALRGLLMRLESQ